jgi:predicted permease
MITYSIGSTVNPVLIGKYGKLIPFSILTSGISYALCLLLKPLHQPDQELFWTSLVCAMSPNAISMPIMVMESLCDLSIVNEDYGGVVKECFAEGTSFTFVYSIGWNILYWSTLYPLLTKISENIKSGGKQNIVALTSEAASNLSQPSYLSRYIPHWAYWSKIKGLLSRSLLTPSMYAIYVGLIIALIPALQEAMFGSGLSILTPFGGTLKTLAQPVVCLNTIVMSASLVRVRLPEKWHRFFIKSEAFVFGLSERMTSWLSALLNTEKMPYNTPSVTRTETADVPAVAPMNRRRVLSQFRQHSLNMRRRLFGSGTNRYRSATMMEMDPFCAVPDYPQPEVGDMSPSREPTYEVESGGIDGGPDQPNDDNVHDVDAENGILSPMWGKDVQISTRSVIDAENSAGLDDANEQNLRQSLKTIEPSSATKNESPDESSAESSSSKTVTLKTFIFHLLVR